MSKQKEESEKRETEQDPERELSIWMNARDKPGRPCIVHGIGFDIKAWSSDYLRLDFIGTKDFPEGSWVTVEDIENFANKLINIAEQLRALKMMNTQGIYVLWKKPNEDC